MKQARQSFILLLLAGVVLGAQSMKDVEMFLDQVAQHPPQTEVPQLETALRPLATASTSEVAKIFPILRSFGASNNVHLKEVTAVALVEISLGRLDGAKLLQPHLDLLAAFLNDTDEKISGVGLMTIGYLKPAPAEVVPTLLQFAQRHDRDEYRQAGALGTALQISPNDPAVLASIEQQASRDLSVSARIRLMDAIAITPPKDERLLAILVSGLNDKRPEVRSRSIYNWIRLGPIAMQKVAVDLERLRTQDPSAEVRAEADKALKIMRGDLPAYL